MGKFVGKWKIDSFIHSFVNLEEWNADVFKQIYFHMIS